MVVLVISLKLVVLCDYQFRAAILTNIKQAKREVNRRPNPIFQVDRVNQNNATKNRPATAIYIFCKLIVISSVQLHVHLPRASVYYAWLVRSLFARQDGSLVVLLGGNV
jgi:hypothetical protein